VGLNERVPRVDTSSSKETSLRELIITFHGLGKPHPYVSPQEADVWWNVEPFQHLLDRISRSETTPNANILITFDDGNVSDVLVALPELVKRRLTATFFICAGRVGTRDYVDEPMIRDLLAAGMHIGSHGMYHRNWRNLRDADLNVEIKDARKQLENITRNCIDTISIPFGSYDHRVLTLLRRENWKCIFTSDGGTSHPQAVIKGRTTLRANMQQRDIIAQLLLPETEYVRMKRALASFHKRLR
jgi:peptidoglycan/xylan/chitin deacetylase (PgdA/CDA1 family)